MALSFGQMSIGTNTYTDVKVFEFPSPASVMVTHQVPKSTVFPSVGVGYTPFMIAGSVRLAANAVDSFMADVLTYTSERKIGWHDGNQEVYAYAYGGAVTGDEVLNTATGAVHIVGFAFTASRSKKYKASDNSVLWGS